MVEQVVQSELRRTNQVLAMNRLLSFVWEVRGLPLEEQLCRPGDLWQVAGGLEREQSHHRKDQWRAEVALAEEADLSSKLAAAKPNVQSELSPALSLMATSYISAELEDAGLPDTHHIVIFDV